MRFGVVNLHNGETIAAIDMDESMIQNPEIVNPETLTCRGLKGGASYTLMPLASPTVVTLKKVRQAYLNITEKPTRLYSDVAHRMDILIQTVGLLFDEVEFIRVETIEDLQNIITPKHDYEQKIVKHTILGTLLSDIMAEDKNAAITDEPEEEPHVHSASCGHTH